MAMNLLQRLPWRSLGKWWVVGIVFLGVGTAVLYVFVAWLHMPLVWATSLSAEVTMLIRFLINDRWVFGHSRPTWKRLWQFHVASAGGFVVWWLFANFLPPLGVQYLIASAAGSLFSSFFSMASNFLWIWRRRTEPATQSASIEMAAEGEGAASVE